MADPDFHRAILDHVGAGHGGYYHDCARCHNAAEPIVIDCGPHGPYDNAVTVDVLDRAHAYATGARRAYNALADRAHPDIWRAHERRILDELGRATRGAFGPTDDDDTDH